jgi:hypothetical protein
MTETSKKIFISHASVDKKIVGELLELLHVVGLKHDQIFCTSFNGYHSIGLGERSLDKIKAELTSNEMVLFVLTSNFYSSPVCMAEMGASWVLSARQIPILVPPFGFSDIRGVLSGEIQSMKITEKGKVNELAETVAKVFDLPTPFNATWEDRRNSILERVQVEIDRVAQQTSPIKS